MSEIRSVHATNYKHWLLWWSIHSHCVCQMLPGWFWDVLLPGMLKRVHLYTPLAKRRDAFLWFYVNHINPDSRWEDIFYVDQKAICHRFLVRNCPVSYPVHTFTKVKCQRYQTNVDKFCVAQTWYMCHQMSTQSLPSLIVYSMPSLVSPTTHPLPANNKYLSACV